MRFLYLIFLFYSSVYLKAQIYSSYNISLFSIVAPETSPNWFGTNTKYAGCYGWHNTADNKEYAILGTTKGNYFIDVSNPNNPSIKDFVPGASQYSLWREIRTYQNYAYLISDDNGSKLQIVDMSYLPDSVNLVYESDNLFSKAHTLFIDGNKLYCGGTSFATTSGYPMAVYDLSNPVAPVLLRTINQDYPNIAYVHDMFVRNDTVYASTGHAGLFIFKYNSNNTFTLLADYTNYVNNGYNHSSYLNPSGKTLIFTDEVPTGLSVKLIDVSDLGNISLIDTIRSNFGATAHNPYITNDNHAIISYYQDGVYIFDISKPDSSYLTGYFDTDNIHGSNDNYSFVDAYRGCWGAYAYLPSGILLASDMQNGLFILDMSAALGIKKSNTQNYFSLFPNPVNNELNFSFSSDKKTPIEIQIIDVMGRVLMKEVVNKNENVLNYKINTSTLAIGSYFIKLMGEDIHITQKVIKTN